MKKVLVLIVLLAMSIFVLWRFYPEALWSVVKHTPLKKRASASTPVYQWRDQEGNWQITWQPE